MPGDYSRFNDITRKHRAALRMQQGRVQLDSDFNELVDILTTRDRLQALDTFGRSAVPRETSRDAFKLTAAGSDNLLIGKGRMYIDGLLVESFGDPATGDPDSYLQQPFVPNPFPLTSFAGNSQVYLDVWQREITAIEDPSLLDPALGDIDTATRLQTVWQVRFMPSRNPNEPLTCASQPGRHSAGRLTVTPAPSTKLPDLCEPPDTPGFYDIENRHYRVQIHDVPGGNTARYKWSREGASVVSRVSNIETITVNQQNVTRLTVNRIGRDAVLRFTPLDWIEVMDDVADLTTMSGPMAQVTDIDEANLTITLDRAIPAIPLGNHPRVILWNQQAGVDSDGLLWVMPGQTVPLERGLAITFTLDPPAEVFRRGDYWLFPARMADPMAAPLDRARPLPEHHFAPLGMISCDPATGQLEVLEDCRVLWPDCDCACAACVTPESHNPGGRLTIQQAIEKVKKKGGGTICVHAGLYLITKPIVIDEASAITIVGLGDVVLLLVTSLPMFDVRQSKNITLENLVLSSGGASSNASAMVVITNCDGPVTLTRNFVLGGFHQPPTGVKLSGELSEVYLLRNAFETGIGVDCDPGGLTTVDARFRDNLFKCQTTGIRLAGDHLAADISHNTVVNPIDAGIVVKGTVRAGGAISIRSNGIQSFGDGIVVSGNDIHIANNTITRGVGDPPDIGSGGGPLVVGGGILGGGGGIFGGGGGVTDPEFFKSAAPLPQPVQQRRSAIWLKSESATGPLPFAIGQPSPIAVDGFRPVRCHVLANRIVEFRGNGIRLSGAILSAMLEQNFITHVDDGGIVMDQGSVAEQLSIENNQIYETGQDPLVTVDASAIRTWQVTALHIRGNRIERAREHGIFLGPLENGMVSHNHITQVGHGGIFMHQGVSADQLTIDNNQIARTGRISTAVEGSGIRAGNVRNLAVLANHIQITRDHGIRLTGSTAHGIIEQNFVIHVDAGGIVMDEGATAGRLSIENNQIYETGQNPLVTVEASAIRTSTVTTLHILANRIERSRDHGIFLGTLDNGMVSQNHIKQVGSGGIFMEGAASAEQLSIENNQIAKTGKFPGAPNGSGIQTASVTNLAVLANHINEVRDHGIRLSWILGAMIKQNAINVAGTGGIVMGANPDAGPGRTRSPERISIGNNQISDVGGDSPAVPISAIRIEGVQDASITDNQITRTHSLQGSVETIACRAFESAQISGNSIAGSTATSRNSSDITLTGNRARVTSNAVRREGGTKGTDVDFCVLFANDIGTLLAGSNDWVAIGSLKAPMVFVGRSTHCTFADNVFTTVNNSLNDAILRIHAENSLIVTSNRAQGGTGVAFDLAPGSKPPLFRWTILGNIVDGDIFINSQALPAPWLALNHLIQGNTQDQQDPNIDNNNTVA